MEQKKAVTKGEGMQVEAQGATKVMTRKRKILGRIGKFLMYGGWMLVVILGLVIAFFISAALNR